MKRLFVAIAAVAGLGLFAGSATAQYPILVPHRGHYHAVPSYAAPVPSAYVSPGITFGFGDSQYPDGGYGGYGYGRYGYGSGYYPPSRGYPGYGGGGHHHHHGHGHHQGHGHQHGHHHHR